MAVLYHILKHRTMLHFLTLSVGGMVLRVVRNDTVWYDVCILHGWYGMVWYGNQGGTRLKSTQVGGAPLLGRDFFTS